MIIYYSSCDVYVLAVGATSGVIARKIGVNLPVYPLKVRLLWFHFIIYCKQEQTLRHWSPGCCIRLKKRGPLRYLHFCTSRGIEYMYSFG